MHYGSSQSCISVNFVGGTAPDLQTCWRTTGENWLRSAQRAEGLVAKCVTSGEMRITSVVYAEFTMV